MAVIQLCSEFLRVFYELGECEIASLMNFGYGGLVMKRSNRLFAIILSVVLCIGSTFVSAYADEPTQEELLAQYYAALAAMSGEDAAAVEAQAAAQQAQAAAKIAAQQAEDNTVLAQILAQKASFPEGTPWGDANTYRTINRGHGNSGVVSACQAFTYLLQDTVFPGRKVHYKDSRMIRMILPHGGQYSVGLDYYPQTGDYGCWEIRGYMGDNPAINQKFEEMWNSIRIGDIVNDYNHSVLVIGKTPDRITVVEGNRGGKVHWGRQILKESLRKGLASIETVY